MIERCHESLQMPAIGFDAEHLQRHVSSSPEGETGQTTADHVNLMTAE
jgi:hypothetical protein